MSEKEKQSGKEAKRNPPGPPSALDSLGALGWAAAAAALLFGGGGPKARLCKHCGGTLAKGERHKLSVCVTRLKTRCALLENRANEARNVLLGIPTRTAHAAPAKAEKRTPAARKKAGAKPKGLKA